MIKLLISLFIALTLAGCASTQGPVTGAPVEAVLIEQGQLASAGIAAAKQVNRLEHTPATKDTIEAELTTAQAFLPAPNAQQLSTAQQRAERAVQATPEQRAAIYASFQNEISRLERELTRARAEEARRAEAESGRREALMMQTQITTYAAIAFMGLGVILGFTGNLRLGVVTIFLGGLLLAASRIIATVPDWAYTVLFITAGLIAIATPLFMWWAYRAGVWTKPDPKCGEYEISDI